MKIIFCVIFLIYSSGQSMAWTSYPLNQMLGHEVGNGAGASENNILFAYVHLDVYIDQVLKKHSNDLSAEEENLLRAISISLSEERRNKKQIHFLSGRKNPGFFRDEIGHIRIAITYNEIGSPIYFNLDLLYQRVQNQILVVSLTSAISLLIHELGHHHNIKDHYFLDNLGAKVAKPFLNRWKVLPLVDPLSMIKAKIIQLNTSAKNVHFDQLMFSDMNTYYDMGILLKDKIKCPTNRSYKLVGLSLWQSYWSNHRTLRPILKNDILLYCQSLDNGKIDRFDNFQLSFLVELVQQSTAGIKIHKIHLHEFRMNRQ